MERDGRMGFTGSSGWAGCMMFVWLGPGYAASCATKPRAPLVNFMSSMGGIIYVNEVFLFLIVMDRLYVVY